ncbi:UNVERIFIED_CONTAM: hypothetical protein HDU68_010558 [Siphonaria sp. JEL0065]|nr:hypothetical protein HDU68_010558 [Siphonaria sp. JEL0065]
MRAVHINFHSRSPNNTPTIALLTTNQTITTKTGQEFQTLHARLLAHSALLHARLPVFLQSPTLQSKIKSFFFPPVYSLCIKQTNEYIESVMNVRDENLVVSDIVIAFFGRDSVHQAALSVPPLTQSSASSSTLTRINSPTTLATTSPTRCNSGQETGSESVVDYIKVKKSEGHPRQASRNQRWYSIYPVLGIWKEEAVGYAQESAFVEVMGQDASEEGRMEDLSYSDLEIESGGEGGQEGVDEVVELYQYHEYGKLDPRKE